MNSEIVNDGSKFEWVSVNEMAKRKQKSTQAIYMQIKQGVYETMEFNRGSMRGYLVKTLKQ